MFENLFVQFFSLVGTAALVAALVNVVKTFGLSDGYASKFSAALSVIAFGILAYFGIFAPSVDVLELDAVAAVWAERIMYILGFVIQIGLPAKFHEFLKNGSVPFIGYSYSAKYADEYFDDIVG